MFICKQIMHIFSVLRYFPFSLHLRLIALKFPSIWGLDIFIIFTWKCLLFLGDLLYIQLHWQFPITYSGFWLVNILLRKFDTSSKKEMKMIKTHTFLLKTNKTKTTKTKKCQESTCQYNVAFFTVNSSHWPVM